jgi:hypothetical protein
VVSRRPRIVEKSLRRWQRVDHRAVVVAQPMVSREKNDRNAPRDGGTSGDRP